MGGGNQEAVKQLQSLMENGVHQLLETQITFFCDIFTSLTEVPFFYVCDSCCSGWAAEEHISGMAVDLLDLGGWEWYLKKKMNRSCDLWSETWFDYKKSTPFF